MSLNSYLRKPKPTQSTRQTEAYNKSQTAHTLEHSSVIERLPRQHVHGPGKTEALRKQTKLAETLSSI